MRLDCEDTLRYYLEVPQRTPANFGTALMARDLMAPIKATKSSLGLVQPEFEAVRFYALNQLVAQIQAKFGLDEPLPDWAREVAREYGQCLSDQVLRMFHYTTLIVTREARHLYNFGNWFEAHGGKYGLPFQNFISSIKGEGSETAVQRFLSSAPLTPLGTYMEGITSMFNTGQWGSQFGGKKWGQIAGTLLKYVNGTTSGEVFVDTAYTLSHNNGPMFNKGMYYSMYTHHLICILDVQRSGQVAEAIIEGQFSDVLTHQGGYAKLRNLCTTAAKELGTVGNYVDWYKVETLGSLHKYSTQKAAQLKKYGQPGAPAQPPKPVVFMGKPAKVVGTFQVLPNQFVNILERVKA